MTSYERGVDEDPARLKKKKKNNQYVAMGPELKACFFFLIAESVSRKTLFPSSPRHILLAQV